MQIKDKNFPYPILNKNPRLTNYLNCVFKIHYNDKEIKQNDEKICINNCYFECTSKTINKLYDENKLDVILIVECSDTIFRNKYTISRNPINIEISRKDLSSTVYVSMYAYAKEDFVLNSDEIDEDYRGIDFYIDKYDILCVDDGFYFHITHKEQEDNLVKSIFSIIVNESKEEGPYNVESNNDNKIIITLSKKSFENYKNIHAVKDYREIFFNMLLIPALIDQLNLCKRSLENSYNKNFSDLYDEFPWFRSIVNTYNKTHKESLDQDSFMQISLVELAQDLLGKPFDSSTTKLFENIKPSEGD